MFSLEFFFLAVIILFFSTLVRSSLGFGDALIAMPLMTLLVDLKTATPTVALMGTTIATVILLKNWKSVDFKVALHLILSSIIGIPLGLFLIKGSNEEFMKILLGLILFLYGVYSLTKPRLRKISSHPVFALLFGFPAGILGGAYNTNGPLVVIYGTLRQWQPSNFRATLQGYFLPTGFFIAAGHGFSGLWTSQVFFLYLGALPFILLAVYLGERMHMTLAQKNFDRYVYLAVTAMGLILAVRAIT